MRLLEVLQTGGLCLTGKLRDAAIPQYAILSHTWGDENEEVTFEDMIDGSAKNKTGYAKIKLCGEQAVKDGLRFFWADSCCIRKTSDAELSESLNSMFRWYQRAEKCYVYLSDVSLPCSTHSTWEEAFRNSRWFTRGWTLQELLAPTSVEFFTQEWKRLGDKRSLERQIHQTTKIPLSALRQSEVSQFETDEILDWARNRQTTRDEDWAYSLLGIFGISMPVIYGEGRINAIRRLMKEVEDNSLMQMMKPKFNPWGLRSRSEFERNLKETLHPRGLLDWPLKAESRDTKLEAGQNTSNWELVRQEINDLRHKNQELSILLETKIGSTRRPDYRLIKDIHLDVGSQSTTLNQTRLHQMLSLSMWNTLPASTESLQYCRSLRNRYRSPTKLPLPDIEKLNAWASRENNSLLLVDSNTAAMVKAFMVDLIDLISTHRMPIFWSLRFGGYEKQQLGVVDIIRMLVLQTLRSSKTDFLNNSFPVTVECLREASTLEQWIAILAHLLSSNSHAFIMLDADLLAHATAYDRGEALDMLDMLRARLPSGVKIVTATSNISSAYVSELERQDACIRIQMCDTKDWRKPRNPLRKKIRYRKR